MRSRRTSPARWAGRISTRITSRVLKNVSSLAFGGADLRTAYVGCLLGDSIAVFDSPVAGHPPAHWRY